MVMMMMMILPVCQYASIKLNVWIKGKGKGAGFKSWSQAGSHDFTILKGGILTKEVPIECQRQNIVEDALIIIFLLYFWLRIEGCWVDEIWLSNFYSPS